MLDIFPKKFYGFNRLIVYKTHIVPLVCFHFIWDNSVFVIMTSFRLFLDVDFSFKEEQLITNIILWIFYYWIFFWKAFWNIFTVDIYFSNPNCWGNKITKYYLTELNFRNLHYLPLKIIVFVKKTSQIL